MVEICVALSTVKAADVPLNFTAVAPVKFVPAMVTAVPTIALVGTNDDTVGSAAPPPGWISTDATAQSTVLLKVPFTVTGPVPATVLSSMAIPATLDEVPASTSARSV